MDKPITFNPSSPGSPLSRARRIKLEKIEDERQYLQARKGAKGIYAYATYEDYVAALPLKTEDFSPEVFGSVSENDHPKQKKKDARIQREEADSSKVRFYSVFRICVVPLN